ncbi:hypothetical protein [Peterkaempfera griseoplana]|uniref:hypothetical protein n=1 Tax=Peterkaempfera griseoplana TaxID=66896 RepID=UPI0006E2FEB7|nr:hypothetical protein [Peterkaempfera griseoplana]
MTAALLLLAACDSGGGAPAGGAGATGEGLPAPAPSTSAAVPSPTPTPYGRSLAGLVDPVGRALGRAAAARSVGDLGDRLADARQAADDAARGLDDVGPPQNAAQPHRDLVAALTRLAADLESVRADLDRRHYCTASAALAGLGASQGLKALPGALSRLARAGYRTSYRAPHTGARQDRRKSTGSYVHNGSRTGRGELTIENGGSQDAVISLAKGKRTAYSVYVRKGADYKVRGVRDGTYTVYFTSGRDWDSKARRFTRDCGFSRFDDPLRFTTTVTSTQIRWSTWRLTLQPVFGGNATTSDLDEGSFPSP